MLHKITEIIRLYRPDIVFSHYGDDHADHDALSTVVPKAVKRASESILGHLGPPHRTDLNAKLEAMKHRSQRKGWLLDAWLQRIHGRAEACGGKLAAGRYAEPFALRPGHPIYIEL